METLSEVTCPACPSCTGGIYLIYDDETTSAISPNASDLEIESEIRNLSTLGTTSVYGNISWINVSTTAGGAGSLCDSESAMTTSIRLRCPYGNLPSFTLVNSVRDFDGDTVRSSLNGPPISLVWHLTVFVSWKCMLRGICSCAQHLRI